MADFFKAGSFATTDPDIFVLHALPDTDADYCGLWKHGTSPVDTTQYVLPASTGLDIIGFKMHCASSAFVAISCGYADARVIAGINGTPTAPIGGLTNVWGDTAAATAGAMGGFAGYCDSDRNDWRGTEGMMQIYIPKLWPLAAGGKYPFIRMRGVTTAIPVYLWVREVTV